MVIILTGSAAMTTFRTVAAILLAGLLSSACGAGPITAADSSTVLRPTIVASTNIIGDVVENIVGDSATVVTIMPAGSDPHTFQASAKQIAQLNAADAVVVNGGGFETGLLDIVESAKEDGALVFEAISAVEALHFDGHNRTGQDRPDPHFFSDPRRMADAVEAIGDFILASVDGIDRPSVEASTNNYLSELRDLDEKVEQTLSAVAPDDRVLLANHEVLNYFGDRYGFQIVGAVIPGGTTADGTNARALDAVASLVRAADIPAIFSDISTSDEIVRTLALEAGNVEVVALYSESLGPEGSDGSTYLEMMGFNAGRIADALTGAGAE